MTGNLAVQNAGSVLTYYSQFASGMDTVVAFSEVDTLSYMWSSLESVEAKLTSFGGTTPNTTVWFDGTEADADTQYTFAFPVDISSLSMGLYDWTVQLTQHYSDSSTQIRTITGQQEVINTLGSSMAAGWFPFGVSSLLADGSDVLLMRSGMQQFLSDGSGGWVHQITYDTNDYTLTGDWTNGFTLTAKDGTVDVFNTSGQITSTTDAAGNVTSYTYSSGKLTSITEPGGESTTFTYNATTGYIESMTKPDAVTSTYTLDGSHRITAITKPDPDGAGPLPAPVTSLAYDGTTGLLTSVSYPDGGRGELRV